MSKESKLKDSGSGADTDDDLPEPDRSGFLEIRSAKACKSKKLKSWKQLWFMLYGSSLYYYKTPMDTVHTGVVQLKGATFANELPDKKKKKKAKFGITYSAEDDYEFNAVNEGDRKEWLQFLVNAAKKEAQEPTVRGERSVKKQSRLQRYKRTMAGKTASSAVGKGIMKRLADDDTVMLLNNLKKVIAVDSSKKQALEIENHIIKIAVKSYFLVENKLIEGDSFLEVDGPLREAFTMLSKIWDKKNKVKADVLEDAFSKVEVSLKKTEKVLIDLLLPYLKPNSINRIKSVFGYLGSARFLKKILLDEDMEEEVHDLIKAMEYYTQFHHYREKKGADGKGKAKASD